MQKKEIQFIIIAVVIIGMVVVGLMGLVLTHREPIERKISFHQEGNIIRGNGMEAYFENGILSFRDDVVIFGPKDGVVSKESNGPADSYQLQSVARRSLEDILLQINQDPILTKNPIQKTINGLIVVEWGSGGICYNRLAEVIGRTNNYRFSSLGCYHDEKTDFDAFEQVISTMKLDNLK